MHYILLEHLGVPLKFLQSVGVKVSPLLEEIGALLGLFLLRLHCILGLSLVVIKDVEVLHLPIL